MNAPKFTPAPWSAEVSSNTSHTVRVVVNSDGEFGDDICVLGDVQTPEIAANARLIAAAPDGFALAEAIIALESSPMSSDYVPPAIRAMARAFIAKVIA